MKLINILLVPLLGLSASVFASPVAVADVEVTSVHKGLVSRQADIVGVLQTLYDNIRTHTGAISK